VKLGLFGGTFDPPHNGHLIVAQDALTTLGLDRVIFVPAGAPPHKRDRHISPAPARLAMLEAALQGDARFEIDALELKREGPSYTVDTIQAIRSRHPDDELFLLVGADQFAEFETWREPVRIAGMARITVLTRAGATPDSATLARYDAGSVEVTRIDISSTDIRMRCASGEPIRYHVPEAVEAWLAVNPIYESSRA
jgi:nicotinate-nucleotide adenylyltransferase